MPPPAAPEEEQEWQEGQAVTGVLYKGSDGQDHTAHAHLTIVCDGMYSAFRRKLAVADLHHPSFFIGLLLKVGRMGWGGCLRGGWVLEG
jgi:squalene monooxygenase